MLATALSLAVACAGHAYETSSGLSTEQLAKWSSGADVFIEVWDADGKPFGTATGFLYAHPTNQKTNGDKPLVESYIITNAHVLKGAASVKA